MKHLDRFINYLNESSENIKDLTEEELEELLIPIDDIGIKYSFSDPVIITDGEFAGHKSMDITFENKFKISEHEYN